MITKSRKFKVKEEINTVQPEQKADKYSKAEHLTSQVNVYFRYSAL